MHCFLQFSKRGTGKTIKPSKITTFVVADSSTRETEQPLMYTNASSQGSQGDLNQKRLGFQTALHPFISTPTQRNGETYPPGKVRPVPDQSVLEIPSTPVQPTPLGPRSYEALQVFDGAPRGYSLVQPVW